MKLEAIVYRSKIDPGQPPVILLEKLGHQVKVLTYSLPDHPMHPAITVETLVGKEFNSQFAISTKDFRDTAKIYIEHAKSLGATPEALSMIGVFVKLTERELHMVTKATEAVETKVKAAKAEPKVAKAKAEPKPKAEPKAAKVKAEPKPKAEPKAVPAKVEKGRAPSVSSRMCELIMEGGRTDEQIFQIVKAEFNLDDAKKGYVSWNRSNLKKKGENPPEVKKD